MQDTIHAQKAETNNPGAGVVITTHRIIEAFGRDPRSLDILHGDVFDSRATVAISAIDALGAIKDARSIPHLTRILQSKDADVQRAAVRAIGSIAAPASAQTLIALSAATRDEAVQAEIHRTLGMAFADSAEARRLLVTSARSGGLSPRIRGAAVKHLLQKAEGDHAVSVVSLAAADAGLLEVLFREGETDARTAQALVALYAGKHARLPLERRRSLLAFSAPMSTPAACAVFLESLEDPNPSVRRECYRLLGTADAQIPYFDSITTRLATGVEGDPVLEEHVLQAIDRMGERLREAHSDAVLTVLESLPATITGLFGELQKALVNTLDTSHELGWLSANAREYLEFYCDEETKKTVLQCLKIGGTTVQRDRAVQRLKDSAVKVEVRHFEGYKLLHELLDHPTRPGVAVVIRHLSLAKVEKRALLCRLKRCLALARLGRLAGAKGLFTSLFTWSRQNKLYRLSERALHALHGAEPGAALDAARECMVTPVSSKILAIAACSLIGEMDPAGIEPLVINLLHEQDRYVRLELLDALMSLGSDMGESLQRALLQSFVAEGEQEIAAKLADLLAAKADLATTSALVSAWERFEAWKKSLAIRMIRRVGRRSAPVKELALTEFLYRALRSEPASVQAHIPAALLALGDDYAARVLEDVWGRLDTEDRIELVRDLRDELSPSAVSAVWMMLRDPEDRLQQVLAEVLPRTSDIRARGLLLDMACTLRLGDAAAAEPDGVESTAPVPSGGIATEKGSYQFEREHVRTCAVLFSDIQGYSTRAQEMTSMEVSALIQEYEGILLPIMEAHKGTLIKRMGDGHLFVFSEPLFVAMAAIRTQKALARFNRLRPENMRVLVRMGVHWGEVVEKIGDVFGNTVNIAARLQTVATGGSICISQDLYEKVAEWVHATDLGDVTVKGIREPIHSWEPTELSLDIPPDRDPTRMGRQPAADRPAAAGDSSAPDQQAVEQLAAMVKQSFVGMRNMVKRFSIEEKELAQFEGELVRRWRGLQPVLVKMRRG